MSNAIHAHCLHGSALERMGDEALREHLTQMNGWHRADGSIEKTFSFRGYHETIAFVNAVAWIAHTEDHHPELSVSFDRCVVRYQTHSVGGVSINDFICARQVDALIAFVA